MTTKTPKTSYGTIHQIHQCRWFSDTAAPRRCTAAVLQCQVVGTWPSRCFLIANHPGIESEYHVYITCTLHVHYMSITCPAFPHIQSSTHKLRRLLFRSKAPLPAWACIQTQCKGSNMLERVGVLYKLTIQNQNTKTLCMIYHTIGIFAAKEKASLFKKSIWWSLLLDYCQVKIPHILAELQG